MKQQHQKNWRIFSFSYGCAQLQVPIISVCSKAALAKLPWQSAALAKCCPGKVLPWQSAALAKLPWQSCPGKAALAKPCPGTGLPWQSPALAKHCPALAKPCPGKALPWQSAALANYWPGFRHLSENCQAVIRSQSHTCQIVKKFQDFSFIAQPIRLQDFKTFHSYFSSFGLIREFFSNYLNYKVNTCVLPILIYMPIRVEYKMPCNAMAVSSLFIYGVIQ
jgi:hypothetical protein